MNKNMLKLYGNMYRSNSLANTLFGGGSKSRTSSLYSSDSLFSPYSRLSKKNAESLYKLQRSYVSDPSETYKTTRSGRQLYDYDKIFSSSAKSKTAELRKLQNAQGKYDPKQVSVSDNKISFDNNSYYSFKGTDGRQHKVVAMDGQLSDVSCGIDKQSADYAKFFNGIASNSPAAALEGYTNSEVYSKLTEIGVKAGFFSLDIGGTSYERYLSQDTDSKPVHTKAQYDDRYEKLITNGGLARALGLKAGDTVTLGDKDYTVGKDGKVNAEYGADLWSVKKNGMKSGAKERMENTYRTSHQSAASKAALQSYRNNLHTGLAEYIKSYSK